MGCFSLKEQEGKRRKRGIECGRKGGLKEQREKGEKGSDRIGKGRKERRKEEGKENEKLTQE